VARGSLENAHNSLNETARRRTILLGFSWSILKPTKRGDSLLPTAAIPDPQLAIKGVSASTADYQIAVTAIRNECALLTTDRDFERIARVSDLALL